MVKNLPIVDDLFLMEEWDYESNKSLDPNKLSRGSNKNVVWICSKCRNKWKTTIYHRATVGSGCPKCHYTTRKNIPFNECLVETNPEIAENWHPTKNHKLTPVLFKRGSRFRVWWQCKVCKNEWESPIQNYNDCFYCKNQSKLNQNNIGQCYPELTKEWHNIKNINLTPKDVLYTSQNKAWWICSKCGHEWKAKISNRSILGRGCPVCANKVIVEGVNDLGTTNPQLAKEWHPTKNGNLTPQHVSHGSGRKVWWTCPLEHEFTATILHRSSGTSCPDCNSGRQTSFAEQATFYYVKQLYPDAISRFKSSFLGRIELDIYIPSIKYAIEYDGIAWHNKKTIKREQLKYKRCHVKGIKLIRLREKFAELGSDVADFQFGTENLYKPKNLENTLREVLKRINFSSTWMSKCPLDINIERDRFKIQTYRKTLKNDSLIDKFPQIAKEWHPTKNGTLMPSMYKPGSDHKIWWNCFNCGNEYEATIGHRTNGTGCPKCGIEKVTNVKRKQVNMIDPNTDKVISNFISISDASRKMKINGSNISMVCRGQRPKAGGYFWSFGEINYKIKK